MVTGPRICTSPAGVVSSLGADAVRWAREVLGVEMYPWQVHALDLMLAQQADGKWAASQAAMVMSRQSGKSLVLMVRELYGILVLGEVDVIHSAHSGDTVRVAYQATIGFLGAAPGPGLDRKEYGAIGRERVDFAGGGTLWFKTRTRSGGRGYSADLIVLDEAQELQDDQMQAMTPTLTARSQVGNPQLCYAGSAGTYSSPVLARVRRKGIAGDAPRLLFLEYSIDDEAFLAADPDARMAMLEDPVQRARANPLYGELVSDDFLTDMLGTLGAIGFAREHMCVGSWPADDSTDWIIPRALWAACADEKSPPPVGAVALAVGASWDRTVSIAACGAARGDGVVCAELTHYGSQGVAQIVAEVMRLRDEHHPCAIVVDDKGPADFLVAPLQSAGVALELVSTREVAAACSGLHAAVTESPPMFRHRGQAEVAAALAGARRKDVGDGWVLDRRRSSADVTPLEVLALARWGFVKFGATGTSVYETREMLIL